MSSCVGVFGQTKTKKNGNKCWSTMLPSPGLLVWVRKSCREARALPAGNEIGKLEIPGCLQEKPWSDFSPGADCAFLPSKPCGL